MDLAKTGEAAVGALAARGGRAAGGGGGTVFFARAAPHPALSPEGRGDDENRRIVWAGFGAKSGRADDGADPPLSHRRRLADLRAGTVSGRPDPPRCLGRSGRR